MRTALDILKGLALLTIAVTGLFLCRFVEHLTRAVDAQSSGITATLGKANTALDTINRPKSGTLSMLDDTMLQGRLSIDALNKMALHADQFSQAEAAMLPKWNAQITGTLDGVDKTVKTFNTDATEAHVVLETANTTIQDAQPLLGRSALFVGHADDFVQTLPPVSWNAEIVTANLAQTTADVNAKLHSLLYPAPCKTLGCKIRRSLIP